MDPFDYVRGMVGGFRDYTQQKKDEEEKRKKAAEDQAVLTAQKALYLQNNPNLSDEQRQLIDKISTTDGFRNYLTEGNANRLTEKQWAYNILNDPNSNEENKKRARLILGDYQVVKDPVTGKSQTYSKTGGLIDTYKNRISNKTNNAQASNNGPSNTTPATRPAPSNSSEWSQKFKVIPSPTEDRSLVAGVANNNLKVLATFREAAQKAPLYLRDIQKAVKLAGELNYKDNAFSVVNRGINKLRDFAHIPNDRVKAYMDVARTALVIGKLKATFGGNVSDSERETLKDSSGVGVQFSFKENMEKLLDAAKEAVKWEPMYEDMAKFNNQNKTANLETLVFNGDYYNKIAESNKYIQALESAVAQIDNPQGTNNE